MSNQVNPKKPKEIPAIECTYDGYRQGFPPFHITQNGLHNELRSVRSGQTKKLLEQFWLYFNENCDLVFSDKKDEPFQQAKMLPQELKDFVLAYISAKETDIAQEYHTFVSEINKLKNPYLRIVLNSDLTYQNIAVISTFVETFSHQVAQLIDIVVKSSFAKTPFIIKYIIDMMQTLIDSVDVNYAGSRYETFEKNDKDPYGERRKMNLDTFVHDFYNAQVSLRKGWLPQGTTSGKIDSSNWEPFKDYKNLYRAIQYSGGYGKKPSASPEEVQNDLLRFLCDRIPETGTNPTTPEAPSKKAAEDFQTFYRQLTKEPIVQDFLKSQTSLRKGWLPQDTTMGKINLVNWEPFKGFKNLYCAIQYSGCYSQKPPVSPGEIQNDLSHFLCDRIPETGTNPTTPGAPSKKAAEDFQTFYRQLTKGSIEKREEEKRIAQQILKQIYGLPEDIISPQQMQAYIIQYPRIRELIDSIMPIMPETWISRYFVAIYSMEKLFVEEQPGLFRPNMQAYQEFKKTFNFSNLSLDLRFFKSPYIAVCDLILDNMIAQSLHTDVFSIHSLNELDYMFNKNNLTLDEKNRIQSIISTLLRTLRLLCVTDNVEFAYHTRQMPELCFEDSRIKLKGELEYLNGRGRKTAKEDGTEDCLKQYDKIIYLKQIDSFSENLEKSIASLFFYTPEKES